MDQNSQRHGGRTSARARLLAAAQQLVAAHGVAQLTLEGVAAAAGVTKGGLIYHFKTRDELLAALVEQMVAGMALRTRIADPDASLPQRLQALAKATFELPDDERQAFAQLLAAASSHPHLMGSGQALLDRIYDDLAQGQRDAGPALLLAAALDGITLLDLLGLHRFTPAQLRAMRKAFNAYAKDL